MALLLALLLTQPAQAARVQDVSSVLGVRENPLIGYGLVVGLNRTGDTAQNAAAVQALAARLKALGMTMSESDIKSRNVAVVMVTGALPAGTRPGSPMDVQVSSVGDASSLEGGILLLTVLYAANGLAVAEAQGAVVVGGFSASSGGDSSTKNHPTVATIPGGAHVEVEIPNAYSALDATTIDWVLSRPDFVNATRMAAAIDGALSGSFAHALDGGTVRVDVPDAWKGKQSELIAKVQGVQVTFDDIARVVVNERTGTVVMGADLTVTPVAIAHAGLTINVDRKVEASQPGPLSNGQTALVANSTVRVDEKAGRIEMIEGVTIGDLVAALNRMGVTPRDLIVILQTMRAAGALQADIEAI